MSFFSDNTFTFSQIIFSEITLTNKDGEETILLDSTDITIGSSDDIGGGKRWLICVVKKK